MGVPGSVLISENVYEKIKNHNSYTTTLLGKYEFRNIAEPLNVYALSNDQLIVPKSNEVRGKAKKKKFYLIPSLIGTIVLLGLLLSSSFLFTDFFFPNRVNVIEPISQDVSNKKSIAVLPFQNLSSDQENQYFTEGMHDDLLTFLSKSKLLKVISRSSVSRLKDTDRSTTEIAKLLDVTHLMEGSIRRIDNQVRINVQLVDAQSDNNLWAENYDIELTTKNILEVQSDIAEKISSTLVQSVFAPGATSTSSEYTQNLDAYENYLLARQLKESGNRESLYEAKRLLEEAIVLDENFAQAHILLGNMHIHLVYYAGESPEVFFPEAERLMNKGKALNPDLSDAHALEGSLNHWWKRDFEASEAAYKRAIELNPNNDNALYGYAIACQDLDLDFKKIDSLMQRALEVNPLNPNLINTSAIYQREVGDIDHAIKTFRKGITIAPEHPNLWANLAGSYYYKLQLDSVALISKECVSLNGKKGTHLRYYLESLANLSALDILDSELDDIENDDKQDIVTKYNFRRDYYFQKREFKKASEVTTLLAGYNSQWPDINLYKFEDAYYSKNFAKAVSLFELNRGDSDMLASLIDRSVYEIISYVNYAYALIQTGRVDKGKEVVSKVVSDHLEHIKNREMRISIQSFYKYINACIAVISGDDTSALEQISDYIESGNLHNVRWIEIDPIFDEVRDNPPYQSIIQPYKELIADQRGAYSEMIK